MSLLISWDVRHKTYYLYIVNKYMKNKNERGKKRDLRKLFNIIKQHVLTC